MCSQHIIYSLFVRDVDLDLKRGYALLTFRNTTSVPAALEKNGVELLGRPLHVSRVSNQQIEHSSPVPKVFLTGLPSNITEQSLINELQTFGTVSRVNLPKDKKSKSQGYALV